MIREETNEFRKGKGRGAVVTNQKLADAADYFALYMARENEYGHTADGACHSQRAKRHGYDYCIVSENIAYAFDSRGFSPDRLADEFFNGWRKSPEHRKNVLDLDVTDVAVAVARSDKTGYYYAVQMFGRPKSLAIKFEVENDTGRAIRYTIGDRTFDLPPRVIRTHERCRPAKAKLLWPGEEGPGATITTWCG